VTFLLSPLQQLLPTSETCYLVELRGRCCIVDELRRPGNGSTVLLKVAGRLEWGVTMFHPNRILTEDGLLLEDDLLEDVTVVGLVTHEVSALNVSDSSPV